MQWVMLYNQLSTGADVFPFVSVESLLISESCYSILINYN